MVVLGVFALVQVIAVVVHFLPELRDQVIAARFGEEAVAVSPAQAENASLPPEAAAAAVEPAAPDPAAVARASQIVSQADKNYRVGDFEGSLILLKEAEAILPNDPSIQFRLGQVHENLNNKAEAFIAFEQSVKNPGLPPEIRREAEQKMAFITESLSATPVTPGTSGAPATGAAASAAFRENSGLQPGSTLGIVSAKLRDSRTGAKSLRIALKAREGTAIDARKMNVHVFFYEQDINGEVLLTEAQPGTQWISPPIDWAEAEPELLDVEYPLPDGGLAGSSADRGAPGRKYHGYIVGVYYDSELQDVVSEPGQLERQFPLELSLPR